MAKRPANRRRGSVLMLDLLARLGVRQRAQNNLSFKIWPTSHLFGFQLVEIQAGRVCQNPGSQVVPKQRKVAVVFLKQILPCLRWFACASPNPLQYFLLNILIPWQGMQHILLWCYCFPNKDLLDALDWVIRKSCWWVMNDYLRNRCDRCVVSFYTPSPPV